jgi:hypothetical protein
MCVRACVRACVFTVFPFIVNHSICFGLVDPSLGVHVMCCFVFLVGCFLCWCHAVVTHVFGLSVISDKLYVSFV